MGECDKAMKIYEPPFKYQDGYIFDAKGKMVADDSAVATELVAAAQIRRWGHIQYIGNYKEPSAIQDAIGEHFAKALTEYWLKNPVIPVDALREFISRHQKLAVMNFDGVEKDCTAVLSARLVHWLDEQTRGES